MDHGKDDYSLLTSLGSNNKLVLFSSFFSVRRGMYGIRINALLGRISLDAPTVNVR